MKRILKDEIVLSESSKTVKILANPSLKVIGLGFKLELFLKFQKMLSMKFMT